MRITSIVLIPLFLLTISDKSAAEPLKPQVIIELKQGYMRTCVPEINSQAVSVGLSFSASQVENYCRCLGTFYFNDLTKADFEEMKAIGDLPERISSNRKQIQEYCSSLHLEQ